MKTTYIYKLYQFENGLGETVWQAKEPSWFFGAYDWVRGEWPWNETACQWASREDAVNWLRDYSQRKLNEASADQTAEQRNRLKLVVIEPVKIEL